MKKILFIILAISTSSLFAASNDLLTKSVVKLIKNQKKIKRRLSILENNINSSKTATSETINAYSLDKRIKKYLEE